MRKWIKRPFASLSVMLFFVGIVIMPANLNAQYNASDGFRVAWSLDPRDDPTNFSHGPAYGARSVQVGMDFDGDGRREILFTTDETLAPGGPDPGYLDVYLYEATGNDSYEHVWHYTMPEGTNSLPALTYGDIDNDGLWEIYFGVPTLSQPNKVFIFEQGTDGVFPDTPTLTWDCGRDATVDFRPSGFQIDDVDGDGENELIVQSRTSGKRELVIAHLTTGSLDEFAAFEIEFEAGNDILGGGGTYDVMVVDYDGDGKKEIWYNTWDMWTMAVFEADTADTYSLQVELDQLVAAGDPGSFNSHDMYFQDIDGDGSLEAWFPMTDGKLYFLESVDSSVADLTADDLFLVGTFNSFGRNRGGSVGDIDDDGRPDIIAGHGKNEKVSRIEYNEIGDPADSSSYTWEIILESEGEPTDRYYPLQISPVDLDGDGHREIVLTNINASEAGQPIIIVLEYDPSTALTLAEDWEFNAATSIYDVDTTFVKDWSGNSRTGIAGMDMDQDGKDEVILTDYAGHRAIVFEYDDVNGVFDVVWTSPVDTASHYANNPRAVGVGDLDNDGKQEIVYPLATTGREGWWIFEWDGVVGSDNYGDTYSSIAAVEIDTCCSADPGAFRGDHERVTIVDIDGDGQQELITMIRQNASGGKRGTLIASVEGDIEHNAGGAGFETWIVEFFVDRADYGGGSPYHSLPVDLDGDGTYELVNHTWNYFNFYNIDATGADSYAVGDPTSGTANYQATSPSDHVSLFGGGAGDIDGDGTEEAFFPNYYTGDLWVVDYDAGDDVLVIDGSHVVNIAEDAGYFYASVFDVDQNGRPNIFVGSAYPKTITSTELIGTDPRNPADYLTTVVYTGEADVIRDIVITDSAGVITTAFSHSQAFASKVQSHFNGAPIDFDKDNKYEIVASFQSNQDSIKTTTYAWNGTGWDTTVTKIINDKAWTMMLFEFTGEITSINEMTFITPEDYKLKPNYPNPFNPVTTIEYELPVDKTVSLKIYNIMGQLVRTLVSNEYQRKGQHSIQWNSRDQAGITVASGIYIYSLEWGNFKKTRRMTLLK